MAAHPPVEHDDHDDPELRRLRLVARETETVLLADAIGQLVAEWSGGDAV